MPHAPVPSTFARVIAVAGGVSFAASLGWFAYRYVEYAADRSPFSWRAAWAPAAIDIGLFTLFALHHTLFARRGLRAAVARVVSPSLERSVYVWVASLLFVAVCWLWQPVPGLLWHVESAWRFGLYALQVTGLLLVVRAGARLDALDLAGIRQTLDQPAKAARLQTAGLYRVIRHPTYLGWILLVWPVATMNGTRLVLAAVSTTYLVVAMYFEERDLARLFGREYADYRRVVRWRVVPGVY